MDFDRFGELFALKHTVLFRFSFVFVIANFILFSGCLFTTSYSRLNFKFLIFFEFHSERRHFEIIWYAPRHGTAIVGNRKTQPNVQKIYLVFFILKVFHCHCCTISKRKSYFCRLYITILLYLPRSAAEFLNKLIFLHLLD